MNRRDALLGIGAATVPLTGCSQLFGGTEQSGSSADGVIELEISGTTQKGNLHAFMECIVRIDSWSAVERGGTRWSASDIGTNVDLVTLRNAEATQLERVWVDSVPAHEFDAVQLSIGEATGTLESGEPAPISVSSPLRFDTDFELDKVETITVTLDIAPVKDEQSNRFQLELIDGTVMSSPGV